LPGDQGVRHMIDPHPAESALVAARWLSAPWINGWLGFADPPLQQWMAPAKTDRMLTIALRFGADILVGIAGGDRNVLATIIGLAGIVGFGTRFAVTVFRPNGPDRLETLLLGIGLFALATAAIIGIGRLAYLQQNPGETYSDRYLVWPSLFWMSFAILMVRDFTLRRTRAMRAVVYAFSIALPFALLPTQIALAGWGAAVYRLAQQSAAAFRSGVADANLLPDDAAASRKSRLEVLDHLRSGHLAMFADPAWELVGTRWTGRIEHGGKYLVSAHITGRVTAIGDDQPAVHLEGNVERGIAELQHGRDIAVLDDSRTVVGLAEFSFIGPATRSLRLDMPRKRGFDGYIRHYDPDRRYTVVSLDRTGNEAIELAPLTTLGPVTN
jgi:hypothetical protein